MSVRPSECPSVPLLSPSVNIIPASHIEFPPMALISVHPSRSHHPQEFTVLLFSRVLRDSTPRFVGPLVRWSVHHIILFWVFSNLWPLCSCPNDEVTSNIAPAHPHATGVAVYLALLNCQWFLHYCSCSPVHDWIAVYPAMS